MVQTGARSGTAQTPALFRYDERQVMTAWESFLTGGDEQTFSCVRSLVRDSWARCKSRGVDARGTGATLCNDPEYLHQLNEKNQDLLQASTGSLLMLRHLLEGTPAMVLLTDRDGVILESFGSSRTLESGRDIHLEVGGGWNEKVAGTNGIGTALRTGKPVLIHAAEHYCQDVKAWTCIAAPIFDPFDGSTAGVVDLSGPTEIFQRHNMTVPVIAARQIEQVLHQRGNDERLQLMEACFNNTPTTRDDDGLVVLDRNGRVVFHKNAPRLAIDGKPKRQIKAGDYLYAAKTNMTEADIANSLSVGYSPEKIQPLRYDNKLCGTAVVFEGRKRSPVVPVSLPASFSKPNPVADNGIAWPLILGTSEKFRQVIDKVGRIAAGKGSVLIDGETGVGKELFGQLFYAHTAADKNVPFVTVNCGAITKDLFGGELFGHVPGAFTGALREGKKGKFEEASGGILCLDEIGEMPLDVQPFLLRALEEKVIYRLGDSKPRPADVRLVALTNRNLLDEVDAGTFRRDLYYRIGGIRISIPPLRERGDDFSILIDHFNRLFASEYDEDLLQFTDETLEALSHYSWPGNVRELRNFVENLHLTSQDRLVRQADLKNSGLDLEGHEDSGDEQHLTRLPGLPPDLANLQTLAIKKAIEENNGNLTLTAKQLGIARSTLYRRMEQSGIKRSFN